jgi:CBS-domain-containing membrane protein
MTVREVLLPLLLGGLLLITGAVFFLAEAVARSTFPEPNKAAPALQSVSPEARRP